ncbi:hypothetical protein VTO42DRAFT_1926 [Malbranchea cinnamomea]
MATAKTAFTIKESPLPPVPPADTVLTDVQWETLLAIADTIIPSIVPKSSPSSSKTHHKLDYEDYDNAKRYLQFGSTSKDAAENAAALLAENATSIPGFKDAFCRIIAYNIPPENARGLSLVLSGLNNRAVSLMLTGSATPFQHQPFPVREAILRGWQKSYLPAIRGLHKSLITLTIKSWVSLSPSLPRVLGLPRVPVHGAPSQGYNYSFLQFPPGDAPEVVETDVVIVGSGCGAGVVAKNLAEAGHRVMVVEKAYHFPPSHFPMEYKEGSYHLFANGGAELTDDGSMAVLSGSTWGGGGTINWSASLQTQAFVRQEWANAGLPFFTSGAFQASLDRVCDYMGVHSNIEHNHGNNMILEGARKLGYTAKPVPQNTAHQKHYCGYCSLGCAGSEKQGPAVSFLVDAAKAGATFVEGLHVDKVLFDDKPNANRQKVAVGVQGTWTSRDANGGTSGEPLVKRQVIIKAKKVIVACGSIQSPLLLLRSGIRNRHIGRHLYLHPVTIVAASFDYDINPWEGGILTSVVSSFENLDGAGHGTKIEALTMLPGFFLPTFPWESGLQYKQFAANLRRTNGFISLTRDRDAGRVYPDPVDGRARIAYTPSVFDRTHMLEGVIAAAKIAYISGAREIRTTSRAIPPFVRSDAAAPLDDAGINDPAFQAWLAGVRKGVPLDPAVSTFASAHQMGSCRMGTSARNSVVDPECAVWGTDGLYVCDASVFPSASGVNPMITNMAIADWVSRRLAERMKRAGGSRL